MNTSCGDNWRLVNRFLELRLEDLRKVATGGVVAHNPLIVELLSEIIGSRVRTPPHPQLAGAIGAALFAME
jgi:activator of 2-hydroxyglutaryl-CoA dehydratase